MSTPEAVLVTGAFGTGKTTVVAEMAELIERQGFHYAALDLDWLAWGWPGDDESEMAEFALMVENLRLIVDNYLRRGNDRFLLAHAIRTAEQMATLRAALPMPLRVVRLTVPMEEIRRRAASDTTTGRADDLERSKAWLAAEDGIGLEDLTLANDRPVNAIARPHPRLAGLDGRLGRRSIPGELPCRGQQARCQRDLQRVADQERPRPEFQGRRKVDGEEVGQPRHANDVDHQVADDHQPHGAEDGPIRAASGECAHQGGRHEEADEVAERRELPA